MKRIITLFAFIGIILFLIIFVSCTVSNNKNNQTNETSTENVVENKEEVVKEIPSPQQGGTLKLAINEVNTLNPLLNQDKTIDNLLRLVYESLVILNDEQKPELYLAESIDVGVDGTYLTVKLKNNIYWHDGNTLKANDIVFTIDALKQLDEKSLYRKSVENISYAKVKDENTVEIVLKQAYNNYLYSLTFPILPAHIYDNQDFITSDMNLNPVGTGPYQFVSYVPMQTVSLKKYDNWHKGLAYINYIEAVITRDDESKVTSFEAGIIDTVNVNDSDWGKFSSNDNWKINEYTTYYYDFIGLNFNNPSLSDRSIRQALVYAIDRQSILNEFLLGHGVLTEVPIHPDSWLNKDELIVYSHNIDKAKNFVGDNVISLDLIVTDTDPIRIKICEAIKEDLSKVGVSINIVSLSRDEYMNRILEGNYDMFYGGWHLSPVADLTFAFGTNGTGNYINYSNSTMDSLLSDVYHSKGNEEQKENYTELISFIENEVPYISLFFRNNAVVVNNKVYGEIKPSEFNIYETIDQWYIAEQNE